jgi:hypothetical protein
VIALAATGCGSSAHDDRPLLAAGSSALAGTLAPAAGAKACGSATAETVAGVAGAVAMRIYAEELSSPGVRTDQHQVESYVPLLSALSSGNRVAVDQAVTSLVYSGTHIVRLRVTQRGSLLADVGGPYILAPVSGELRWHGRVVGRYLLSVQDDLGYVKLESRFLGVPLVLRRGSHRVPLEGTLAPGPANPPPLGLLTYAGATYEAFSFTAKAFPSGALRVSLLVSAASPSTRSCAVVRAGEVRQVAQRIWVRYALASAPLSAYVREVHNLARGLSFIRAGSAQLAGSASGPARLPARGAVRYHGTAYQVSSFAVHTAGRSARVYVLSA